VDDRSHGLVGADLDAAIWHLNDSHAAESLLMVRTLGGRPGARSAWVGRLDQDGIDFVAEMDGAPMVIRLPWTERAYGFGDPRRELNRLYEQAGRMAV
jgi:heme oxygenase (biliverdin-producing, ferredoxin)